ncbi:tyrosine-type recombinase/integrase, partial [Kibdelosporangium lantanae]
MARVWIYDRNKSAKYKESVRKAKEVGRNPPGRWMVMFYDQASKQRSEVYATKALAESRQTELSNALAAGSYIDASKSAVTLGIRAEKWLAARHDLRLSTWWKYRGLLDNHVLPRWGETRLSGILGEDISEWVATLVKARESGGAGLGASQTRHAFRVLSMVLEWSVPTCLRANPARGVRLPIRPDAEHVYLTYDQVERLANAAGSLTTKYDRPTAGAAVNRALILLLAYTGIRWGEGAALRVGRVDLENRRIRVASTFYEVNGVQHEGLPKTGKKRSVAIPTSLVPELRAIMAGRGDDDLLFTTKRGLPLRANNWRVREFNAAVQAAK